MPGFMIHLAEAEMLMNYMKVKPDLEWRRDFLMGNLLPDTRLGADKKISHFWDEISMENIARAPKLARFLHKYGHRLDEPVVLGYYAHLYLDERYVNAYWPTILEFQDVNDQMEPRKDYIHHVLLKQKNKIIPFEEFFSVENYYGDYTRSNHWLVERYGIVPPKFSVLSDVHMDEVRVEDLQRVIEELHHIYACGHEGDEKDMRVFELESLDDFVRKTAKEFQMHIAQMGLIR